MVVRLLGVFLLFSGVVADGCNGTLSYSEACVNPQFTPDCSWIMSNLDSICPIMNNEIINGNGGCHIVGETCSYNDYAYDTLNVFCCMPPVVVSNTALFSKSSTLSPLISYTSYKSLTVSSSPLASPTNYRSFTNTASISVSKSPSSSTEDSTSMYRSFTNTRSVSVSKSAGPTGSISASPQSSKSGSSTASISSSARPSRSVSVSATSSATVFYNGNWTDHGSVYWNVPISNTGSMTISSCMTSCWINPLCGGISVNTPCNTLGLDSPNIYTTVCANCFLVPIDGTGSGDFYANAGWQSHIIYDKMYPPTGSAAQSKSPSLSALPTASVVTNSTWNFCASSGKTVYLPFIGSSSTIMTNAAGTNYVNNQNCLITFTGAGNSQMFDISFTGFITQENYDHLRIYNNAGAQIWIDSGNLGGDFHVFVPGPKMVLQFSSDQGTVFSGVNAIVSLVYTSETASPSVSPSNIASRRASGSIITSKSNTASASATSTVFYVGNWTDYGQVDYANSDITSYNSITFRQCQVNCYLNPLCGLIVVKGLCVTSSDPNTVCSTCWIKTTSGWNIAQDVASRTFMLHDRVYPPTVSVTATASVSVSALPTASLITQSSYDMCVSNGLNVTLPFVESLVSLETNKEGQTYNNSKNCRFFVGGGYGRQFNITYNSFVTESCCDHLTIYNSNGVRLSKHSGIINSTSFVIYGTPSIQIAFTTDGSVVGSGVFLTVQLMDSIPTGSAVSSGSPSASSLLTITPTNSGSPSASSLLTITPTNSGSPSASSLLTRTPVNSGSPSFSSGVTGLPVSSSSSSFSSSSSYSMSNTKSPSVSASSSWSIKSSTTSSSSRSIGPTHSPITFTSRNTASFTSSYTISISPSRVATISPTSSASNLKPAGPPPALPANLSSLSLEALGDLFNSMANYPATLLVSNLNKLGMAALANSPSGEFGISTSTFAVKIKSLSANNISSVPLSIGKTGIDMPKFDGAAATSAIAWTSNPYDSPVQPDSMVLSLNVLNSDGSAVAVHNSSKPIIIHMNLNPAADDPRFLPPPSYLADCNKGTIYVKSGTKYVETSSSVNNTGYHKWSVPCLLNDWRAFNCSAGDSIITYNCPPLIFTPKCQYWDTGLGAWSTDGCVPIFSNASLMICSCDHLTDFSSRMDAVAQANVELFNNAANVYSLEGLLKFALWYGIFGGIGLLTLLLGYIAMIIDRNGTREYVRALLNNQSINPFLALNPKIPVFSYDPSSKYYKAMKANKREGVVPKKTDLGTVKSMGCLQRVFLQHSRLQFIFKYDPRLSRVFRLLFLFVLQFHSLFITALMYNFTFNGGPMMWYDTVILSLITTALNMPVIRIIVESMNKIGMLEFKAQFPLLYEEYNRRLNFETYAMYYIFNNRTGDGDDESYGTDDNNSDYNNNNNNLSFLNDDTDDSWAGLLLMCFSGSKTEDKKHELKGMTYKDIMKTMINIVKEPYPYYEEYSASWQNVLCHTWQGAVFIIACFGWLAWCLNYLLLFAAAHQQSVGEGIMISYATSEVSTIFLIQPATIMATMLVYYLVKRYENYVPTFIKRFFINRKIKTIPSIFYYSDPWNKKSKSPFTSEFAYNIFVACPAAASGTNELAYAPISAVAEVIDGSAVIKSSEVLVLYKRILKIWEKIKKDEKLVLRSIDNPSASQ